MVRYLYVFLFIGVVVIFVVNFRGPSSKGLTEDQINFLASDAHVVVGKIPLVLPFVALPGYVSRGSSFSLNSKRDRQAANERLATFRQSAFDPRTAPTIPRLEVSVRTYGWNEFGADRLCDRFTRQWPRSVCDNPWAALQQALPSNSFDLIDLQILHDPVQGNVGRCLHGEDRTGLLTLQIGKASLLCKAEVSGSEKERFYTAVIALEGNLGAVWLVFEGDRVRETAMEQAQREGDAIAAFVANGLRTVENFTALHETACALRRPKSDDAPSGPDCD
ncbi:MAG: hypothetical protein KF810_02225 [Rhizobiaceae bacterium]|nr:hypothetical protein [Rhizobiaceae bacterium]